MASASDDGKIAIWRVPDDFKLHFEDPEEIKDIQPIKKLKGHARKVGSVLWHPVASDILASSSNDYSVKVWNVETGDNLYTLQHKDIITSFSFNHDGSLIATVCRDKVLRVWDIRAEKIIQEGPGHTGAKASKVIWLGDKNRLITTGFSKLSDRQFALWDASDIAAGPINGFTYLDGSSGSCIPYFDDGTNCLYLSGKGDGNVRYFEYESDGFYPLSEYQSSDPQRGMCFLPKRAVSTHEHEVVRFFKSVNDSIIEPISFIVPRRAETFQEDIYPEAFAGEPALTAEEWISGKNSPPKVISMEAVFDGVKATSTIAVPKPEAAPVVAPVSQPKVTPKQSTPAPKEEAPKQLDEALASSKEVDSLLTKAKNSDDTHIPKSLSKEESSWDAEPVPTRRPSPPVEAVKPVEAKPVEAKVVPKSEAQPISKPIETKPSPKDITLIDDDDELEELQVVKTASTVAPSSAALTPATPVGNVEALSKQVLNLEAKVAKLLDAIERIDGGQAKILALLNAK